MIGVIHMVINNFLFGQVGSFVFSSGFLLICRRISGIGFKILEVE